MTGVFVHCQPLLRQTWRGVAWLASFRAGQGARDPRTQAVIRGFERDDVEHAEVRLPADLTDSSLIWARDRSSLWTRVESDTPGDRLAYDLWVALPGTDLHQHVNLSGRLAQALADRYRTAIDLSVHRAGREGDSPHAHLLMSTRELTLQGLGSQTWLESWELTHPDGPKARSERQAIRDLWKQLLTDSPESSPRSVPGQPKPEDA